MDTNRESSLPKELTTEIFSCLPLNALLQLGSVNKYYKTCMMIYCLRSNQSHTKWLLNMMDPVDPDILAQDLKNALLSWLISAPMEKKPIAMRFLWKLQVIKTPEKKDPLDAFCKTIPENSFWINMNQKDLESIVPYLPQDILRQIFQSFSKIISNELNQKKILAVIRKTSLAFHENDEFVQSITDILINRFFSSGGYYPYMILLEIILKLVLNENFILIKRLMNSESSSTMYLFQILRKLAFSFPEKKRSALKTFLEDEWQVNKLQMYGSVAALAPAFSVEEESNLVQDLLKDESHHAQIALFYLIQYQGFTVPLLNVETLCSHLLQEPWYLRYKACNTIQMHHEDFNSEQALELIYALIKCFKIIEYSRNNSHIVSAQKSILLESIRKLSTQLKLDKGSALLKEILKWDIDTNNYPIFEILIMQLPLENDLLDKLLSLSNLSIINDKRLYEITKNLFPMKENHPFIIGLLQSLNLTLKHMAPYIELEENSPLIQFLIENIYTKKGINIKACSILAAFAPSLITNDTVTSKLANLLKQLSLEEISHNTGQAIKKLLPAFAPQLLVNPDNQSIIETNIRNMLGNPKQLIDNWVYQIIPMLVPNLSPEQKNSLINLIILKSENIDNTEFSQFRPIANIPDTYDGCKNALLSLVKVTLWTEDSPLIKKCIHDLGSEENILNICAFIRILAKNINSNASDILMNNILNLDMVDGDEKKESLFALLPRITIKEHLKGWFTIIRLDPDSAKSKCLVSMLTQLLMERKIYLNDLKRAEISITSSSFGLHAIMQYMEMMPEIWLLDSEDKINSEELHASSYKGPGMFSS